MDLLRQLVEHALQVLWQRAREFHPPFLRWMCERQPCSMKKRTREMRDGAEIAGDASVHAPIKGIADYRMPDGAQVDTNLVRTSRVNRDVRERQDDAEFVGLDDPRDRLPAAPRFRGHFFSIRRIAPDRRIDATASLYLAPDERDVFLFDLAIAKLA
jgi:hypothetical protein